MSLKSLFTQLLGAPTLEGRVTDLRQRSTPQVLPRCENCGFGTMRVVRPTNDPWEEKLDSGQTRMRCDRVDCATIAVVNSRDVVAA